MISKGNKDYVETLRNEESMLREVKIHYVQRIEEALQIVFAFEDTIKVGERPKL